MKCPFIIRLPLQIILALLSIASVRGELSTVDWNAIQNPVYAHPEWSVKDACVAFNGDEYVVFFSAFFQDRGQIRSYISAVRTRDFRSFSEPFLLWTGEEDGWTGLCSPNISRIDGKFVLTFNTWGHNDNGHPNGRFNQLLYAVSEDLISWSDHRPLGENLTRGKRAIDAALYEDKGVYFLVWKAFQTPKIAYARDLDGEWTAMEDPDLGWFENAQILDIDGETCMLFTGRGHHPYLVQVTLFNPDGEPAFSASKKQPLVVPLQSFNTHERANAAFMWCEAGKDGLYRYLIYAGSTEGESYAGRGYNRLGLVRSLDGIHWSVPGGRADQERVP